MGRLVVRTCLDRLLVEAHGTSLVSAMLRLGVQGDGCQMLSHVGDFDVQLGAHARERNRNSILVGQVT